MPFTRSAPTFTPGLRGIGRQGPGDARPKGTARWPPPAKPLPASPRPAGPPPSGGAALRAGPAGSGCASPRSSSITGIARPGPRRARHLLRVRLLHGLGGRQGRRGARRRLPGAARDRRLPRADRARRGPASSSSASPRSPRSSRCAGRDLPVRALRSPWRPARSGSGRARSTTTRGTSPSSSTAAAPSARGSTSRSRRSSRTSARTSSRCSSSSRASCLLNGASIAGVVRATHTGVRQSTQELTQVPRDGTTASRGARHARRAARGLRPARAARARGGRGRGSCHAC